MILADAIPNEIWLQIIDMATSTSSAVLAVRDDCMWSSQPQVRADAFTDIAKYTSTCLSMARVCRLWRDLILPATYRCMIVRWTDPTQLPTGILSIRQPDSFFLKGIRINGHYVHRLDFRLTITPWNAGCHAFWTAAASLVSHCPNLRIVSISGAIEYIPLEVFDIIASTARGNLEYVRIESTKTILSIPASITRLLGRKATNLRCLHVGVAGPEPEPMFSPSNTIVTRPPRSTPSPACFDFLTSYSYIPDHEGVFLPGLRELSVHSQMMSRLLQDRFFLLAHATKITTLHLEAVVGVRMPVGPLLEHFLGLRRLGMTAPSTKAIEEHILPMGFELPSQIRALGFRISSLSNDISEPDKVRHLKLSKYFVAILELVHARLDHFPGLEFVRFLDIHDRDITTYISLRVLVLFQTFMKRAIRLEASTGDVLYVFENEMMGTKDY